MASGAGKNIFLTRALEKILAERERGEVKMPHYERPVSQPSVRHYPVYQFRISKSTHKAGGMVQASTSQIFAIDHGLAVVYHVNICRRGL